MEEIPGDNAPPDGIFEENDFELRERQTGVKEWVVRVKRVNGTKSYEG